ncbi:hypothetical protein MWH25_01180 [Natroniella acetigena]|uniref:hypothetical protein n=1 Tax=Natroniella acetigena TaxID=52004 RepID=UPI00200B938D|nr:hypothetical protein [Natroniella acetigena]MCK8826359.1 hypothetical protein [Natroniella acetigena]
MSKDSFELCPECHSKKIKVRGGCTVAVVGIFFIISGIFILFFTSFGLIGVGLGLLILISAPFTKKTSFCKSCNNSWQKEKMPKQSFDSFYSKITGVTHDNEDGSSRQKLLKGCEVDQKLSLEHSPNYYDLNAVKVLNNSGQQLGWLTKRVNKEIAGLLNAEEEVIVKIKEFTGGTKDRDTGCNIRVIKPVDGNKNYDYLPSNIFKKAEEQRIEGNVEKAEELYLKSINTGELTKEWQEGNPDHRPYKELAKLYYHTNRDNEAIKALDRYIDLCNNDSEINDLREKISKREFRRLKNKYK